MTREEAIEEIKSWAIPSEKGREVLETLIPELRKEEKPLTSFQQCLNCILRGAYYAEVPDEKVNEFILNVVRTRTDELIKLAKKQEEQKHPDGCFTCDEYKKGYEAGRLNGFTAGYNKAMKEVEQKEQKPWKVGANAYFTPEQKPKRERKKPKESWLEKAKYELEHADELLIKRQEELREIRELKNKEQKPIDVDYISGIREELLGIEDNAKTIDGLTESQWVAIRAAHRLLGEYIEKEQKPAEWSEEDENIIDTIVSVLGQYIDYKAVSGTGSGYATPRYSKEIDWLNSLRTTNQGWNEKDEEMLEEIINHIYTTSVQRIPARPGSDIGKSWIKFLKSLRPQPKQEWSEEDIKKIRSEEYTKGFNDAAFGGKLKEWSVEDEDRIRQIERIAQQAGCTQKLQEEIHDWLKSLRPSWRPSEEQMEALKHYVDTTTDGEIDLLYNDLKKLM